MKFGMCRNSPERGEMHSPPARSQAPEKSRDQNAGQEKRAGDADKREQGIGRLFQTWQIERHDRMEENEKTEPETEQQGNQFDHGG
jgi:hypothetical protein